MKLLNVRLSGAQEDREQAAQAVARLEAQLAELKEQPVEVAVETVVDQAAIDKAREEAQVAVSIMQAKLDKARYEKERAEARQKKTRRRPWNRSGSSWRSRTERRKRPPWGRTRTWPSLKSSLTRARIWPTRCGDAPEGPGARRTRPQPRGWPRPCGPGGSHWAVCGMSSWFEQAREDWMNEDPDAQ